MDTLLYQDITYQIRGACFDVWKELAGAFKEKVIENALVIALEKHGLFIERQRRIKVKYEEKPVGFYTPDLIVSERVLVELKCKPFITIADRRQFWYYMKASDYKVGLLINFGPQKLEIKRVVYDTARRDKKLV